MLTLGEGGGRGGGGHVGLLHCMSSTLSGHVSSLGTRPSPATHAAPGSCFGGQPVSLSLSLSFASYIDSCVSSGPISSPLRAPCWGGAGMGWKRAGFTRFKVVSLAAVCSQGPAVSRWLATGCVRIYMVSRYIPRYMYVVYVCMYVRTYVHRTTVFRAPANGERDPT